jgi:hypothetical protein
MCAKGALWRAVVVIAVALASAGSSHVQDMHCGATACLAAAGFDCHVLVHLLFARLELARGVIALHSVPQIAMQ